MYKGAEKSRVFSSCNSLTYAIESISTLENKTKQTKPKPHQICFFQRPMKSYAALLPEKVNQWLCPLGESFLMLYFRDYFL